MPRRITVLCLFLLSLSIPLLAQTVAEMTPLEVGQTVEKELAAGKSDSYKVRLGAKQFITVETEEKTTFVSIYLLDSAGNLISIGRKTMAIAVEEAGDYEIRINSLRTSAGLYSVKISSIKEATQREIYFGRAMKLYRQAVTISNNDFTINGLQKALANNLEAGENFRLAERYEWYSTTLNNIALNYGGLGNLPKAEEAYKLGVEAARTAKDQSAEFVSTVNYAGFLSRKGKYQDALKIYLSQLEYAKTIKDFSAVIVLENISDIYRAVGDYEKAEYFALQVVEILSGPEFGAGNTSNSLLARRARIYNRLGAIRFSFGDKEKTLSYFEEATKINRLKNDWQQDHTIFLSNLGMIHFELGDVKKSIELLNEALTIVAPNQSSNRTNYAAAYTYLGRIFLQLNELEKAEGNLLKALEFYRQVGDLTRLARVLLSLAKVKKKAGKFDEAQKYLDEALQLMEGFGANLRANELKTSFSIEIYEFYNFQANLFLEKHKLEPDKGFDKLAWLATERGRARSLLNLLNEANANIYEGVEKNLLEKEKETYNLLNSRLTNLTNLSLGRAKPEQLEILQKEIEKIKIDFQSIQAEVREKSPRYAALTQPKIVSIDEIRNNLLDNNTVILSYSLDKENSLLWLISKEKAISYPLPKREIIESKAREVSDLLNARNKKIKFEVREEKEVRIAKADKDFLKASNELGDLLLSGVANQLGNKRIVIIADGALQYIPFAGLRINNRYLIESNEVVNLPSVSALSILRNAKKTPANKTITVLADPVFSIDDERLAKNNSDKGSEVTGRTRSAEENESWENWNGEQSDFYIRRLPFTRQEAEAVSKLAPANQQKISLDFEATKELAMSDELKDYRIVHFATHGILNSKNPSLSGLIFSMVDKEGKPRNGFLRTDETYNLKLAADLVVLSGCKTGLGKEIRGEGLVGMTRGFMYAGASRVMVSLWDVDDQATAELMKNFYQNLLGKKIKTGKALRETQLLMLKNKQYSAPYYWAAFTLHGEF